jgi:hypothetical protein
VWHQSHNQHGSVHPLHSPLALESFTQLVSECDQSLVTKSIVLLQWYWCSLCSCVIYTVKYVQIESWINRNPVYKPNISLERVEMNFCPGSKNSIIGKTARYDRIINELCYFYKVSLIKTRLMFHKYHLLNQFMKGKYRGIFGLNIFT